MLFGLKNPLQIYQRLIDNALYGYLKIGADPGAFSMKSSKRIDLFTEEEPDTSQTPSVLGRRSCIDETDYRYIAGRFIRKRRGIDRCMRQVKFVD